MKIIWIDRYNRDTVANRLVASDIKSKVEGEIMRDALRHSCHSDPGQWYLLVEDDYKLWRGMEELV